mmetsp:Transcript_8960/g.19251  ORF Transcript_8960/g.19251 Transcript_8960/m.19251 type:complete len:637 (-) Transcript_8960:29-1939(-)
MDLLSRAAAELAARSEVDAVLTSLLQDVEHAHSLEQSLNAQNELRTCRANLEALRARYDDREAAWEADRREKERLGLLLLEQVVKLSAREVQNYHDKEADLKARERLEEEKRAALIAADEAASKTPASLAINGAADGVSKSGKEEGSNNGTKETLCSSENNTPSLQEDEIASNTISCEEAKPKTQAGAVSTHNVPNLDERALENPSIEGQLSKESSTQTACPESPILPHDLDDKSLMLIFEYLDPMEVMNLAQSYKTLFKRVNIMFGMEEPDNSVEATDEIASNVASSDIASGEAQVSTPQVQSVTTESRPSLPPPSPKKTVMGTANDKDKNITEASTPSRPPKASPKSSPALLPVTSPATRPTHKRQGSNASAATASSAGTAKSGVANPFSQVSSWFGGSADAISSQQLPASVTPSTAATTNGTSSASSIATDNSEIKFSTAMAMNMAEKLSQAELSIILRMREKLQRCEADAAKWRAEKEDAVANLKSVEAVKEFLVTRVRDTENAVQAQKDKMKDVQRKSLEDQEVISFLDQKVKDLERSVKELESNEESTKQESRDVVAKNEKKVRVLSDMLQFEREQMSANEKEWKGAKKVLIKEVKSCRARILALEAEMEGVNKQNSHLRRGLLDLSKKR